MLTNAKIQAAKPRAKPTKLADAGGLYLEVRPSGGKLWRYRYRIDGRENIFALGQFYHDKRIGHMSLDAARRARDEARDLVHKGIHPAHYRGMKLQQQLSQNKNTFEALATEWLDRKQLNWSERYARQVKHVLETDVFPAIGSLPISIISAADLLVILQRVEGRGASTFAHAIRQWASSIFRYAVVTLRAPHDPVAALRGAIIRKKVRHSKPLARPQIRMLLERLTSYQGEPATVIALKLMLLTFVRTVELRGASWDEINFSDAEWRIPADRMKMREEHVVPLSRQASTLLAELQPISGHGKYLFPNRRRLDAYITATTLNRALERMRFLGHGTIGFSAHGFRATASTILNEAGFRPDVIERQLAHRDRNQVRASYNQAAYLDERRQMMQAWADLVDRIGQPVDIKIVGRAA